MLLVKSLLALATLLPFTTALPASLLDRAACVDTCGRSCYWESDITAAQNKGYSLYQSGQTEGSNKYPHSENNYEGFDFPVDGPYLEFPILSTFKVYTGGNPGPDRVVFNTANELAGVVTHTGARGNDFVQCTAD